MIQIRQKLEGIRVVLINANFPQISTSEFTDIYRHLALRLSKPAEVLLSLCLHLFRIILDLRKFIQPIRHVPITYTAKTYACLVRTLENSTISPKHR